jgi:hypothetical protein
VYTKQYNSSTEGQLEGCRMYKEARYTRVRGEQVVPGSREEAAKDGRKAECHC